MKIKQFLSVFIMLAMLLAAMPAMPAGAAATPILTVAHITIPTVAPTEAPTAIPTPAPTEAPTVAPTPAPINIDDTVFTSAGEDSWNFAYGGEYHYWKVQPSKSATYIFESTLSSGDSYGYLYDSNFYTLTSNDDGGNGYNFKISHNLTAGHTYYYGVRWYSSSTTGAIPVKLTMASLMPLPTEAPTMAPTAIPTVAPTVTPTPAPTASNTTVERIGATVKHYGASNSCSPEKAIFEMAKEYNDACKNYMKTVKDEANIVLSPEINNMANECKKEKMITSVGLAGEFEDVAYQGLAYYMSTITNKGIDLGKINLNKEYISISTDIVKKCIDGIEGIDKEYHIIKGKMEYTVKLTGGSYYGAIGATTIEVSNGYVTKWGTVNSSIAQVTSILNTSLDNMRDTVDNLYYQALYSVFADLGNVTGFSDLANETLENIFKKTARSLKKHGFGKILNTFKACNDGYQLVSNPIVSAAIPNGRIYNNGSLYDLLNNTENIEKMYKDITSLDYSEDAVEKFVVAEAVKRVKNARDALAKGLYDYVYDRKNIQLKEKSFWEKAGDKFKSVFRIGVHCPVDFTVYGNDNNVLGYVNGDEVYSTEDIYIETNGDQKTLYIPTDMQYRIELNATDDGEFNYIVEEVADGEPIGRLNYYDIPITQGQIFTQSINAQSLSTDVSSMPLITGDEIINADEYLSEQDENAYITISASETEYAMILGTGEYAKGDAVELQVIPTSNYRRFIGWYDGDNCISTEKTYRFTALSDLELSAEFEQVDIADDDFSAEISQMYSENIRLSLYKNEDGTNDIVFYLNTDESDSFKVRICAYSSLCDAVIDNAEFIAQKDKNNRYKIENIDLRECNRAELYDEDNNSIVTFNRISHILNIDDYDFTDDTVELNIYAKNKTDSEIIGQLIIVVYENDVLKFIKVYDEALDANAEKDIQCDFERNGLSPEDCAISVFWWDSFSAMTPVLKAVKQDFR